MWLRGWLLLLWILEEAAAHPCEAEVSSACPDRPPSELAACLKNPAEHETATTLSSECTDFVALNKACEEDIRKYCDEGFFSEDTILCLKTWTDPESISAKCTSVMKWAIPSTEEEEQESKDGPTDELGMSDKDYEEKKQWQAKRKAERGDAIERMKMKEADAKKERERVELENFKREHPEEYQEMLRQQEEDKRQAAEQKKRERLLAAALERKKRHERGMEEEDEPSQKSSKRPPASRKNEGSTLKTFLGILLMLAALAGAYFLFAKFGDSQPKKAGKRKKRG